jgi:hypothetical protein
MAEPASSFDPQAVYVAIHAIAQAIILRAFERQG